MLYGYLCVNEDSQKGFEWIMWQVLLKLSVKL
jgi:hypothetical protein